MRFLIVVPRYINRVGKHYEFPLGLAYISSSLKHNGYHVECLNLNHYNEQMEVIMEREIIDKNIDIICTGGLSVHFKKVRAILDAAKKIKSEVITIIGGGLVSSDPILIMNTLNPNFGVIGEGEETIVELADTIKNSGDFSKVKGMVYFDTANNLITTAPRPSINDIDCIPHPDYEGFEIDRYLGMQMPNDEYHMYPFDKPRCIPLIASRSCPYSCTFCYHPLGKKYRQRSLDSFFAELDYMVKEYDINMIAVVDELFSADKKRIQEFCERIKNYNLKWMTQMRVDSVDKETLFVLKDSGCFVISYGLESASKVVLKSMKKHVTISQIESALKSTYEAGIGIQGNFIFGDREETWETANETLDWWFKHKKYQVNLTPIFVYPGTELYHHAIGKNIIDDPVRFLENECPQLNISKMSNDEYGRLMGLIHKYRIENPIPAKVISCIKTETNPYKGDLYTIKIECPHCLNIIAYNNMHQDCNKIFPLGCRVHCRQCNQRFDLLPFKFYEEMDVKKDFNKKVDVFQSSKKIAIYGAGIAGSNIYEYCINKGKEVFYFIDDFKEGKWCGLEIIKPEDVDKYPIPELTIFACGSMNFLPAIIEKMKAWSKTKTFLYAQTLSTEALDINNNEAIWTYYSEYYFNHWLPLLEKGLP